MPHDPQRYKLYKMEREYIGTSIYHKASLKDLQMVANHVCGKWKVPPIRVRRYSSKEKTFGYYENKTNRIYLNAHRHGQNIGVLLHELAHHITDMRHLDAQDHGPEFCYVYACLLDRYRILPMECFRLLADKWGVTVA